MPSLTFRGFSGGASVALSATQGVDTVSSSVTGWGQIPMASIDILKVESEMVAPAGVWFEAIGLSGFAVPGGPGPGEDYDPSFHEITYVWDFGDPGVFDAALNLPDAWTDRNVAYGKRAAHVYRAAGTYTVRLWAVDRSGTWAEATTTVTVGDPDTAYPGGRTICYSQSGDFAGAPGGAQLVTSDGALQDAVAGLSQTGRVLFKRGSDQTVSLSFYGGAFNQNIRFDAWGAGARPIVRPPRNGTAIEISQSTPALHRTVAGIDFRGDWDPTTEVGGFLNKAFDMFLSDANGMFTVFHDCRFSGLSDVGVVTIKAVAYTSVFSDCIIENWSVIGCYGHAQNDGVNPISRIAFLGTAVQQHPDACHGTDGERAGLSNQQGPIRYETQQDMLFRSSYLFSNTSWAAGAQPCIRIGTTNPGGLSLIVDRGVFEGGSVVVEQKPEQDSQKVPGNFLFDRMLVVATADTSAPVLLAFGGSTVRNTLIYWPNTPLDADAYPGDAIESWAGGSSPANLNAPVAIHNVSFLNELSAANNNQDDIAFAPSMADFNNLTVENILHYAPNQNNPALGDLPLGPGDIPGFTPRYPGIRNSIGKPAATSGDVPSGGTITFAYPVGQDGATLLSASDFNATGGRHFIRNAGTNDYSSRDRGDFTVTLGGGGVTVTNTSGATWPGGEFRLQLEYLNYVTDAAHASPPGVPLGRPGQGSGAFRTGGGLVALDDFLLQRRPGLPAPGSPQGASSQGCVEPL